MIKPKTSSKLFEENVSNLFPLCFFPLRETFALCNLDSKRIGEGILSDEASFTTDVG